MRLPKSPEEQRAAKAARQQRWRENKKRREAVAAAVDRSMGLAPGPTGTLPKDVPAVDLARLVRDRISTIVGTMSDTELMHKDTAPALAVGLRAQKQVEDRERALNKPNESQMLAQVAFKLIELVGGRPSPLALPDPTVIEGDYVEAD